MFRLERAMAAGELAHAIPRQSEEGIGEHGDRRVVNLRGDGDGALAVFDGPLEVQHHIEVVCEERGDQTEPAAVAQGVGELLRFGQMVEHSAEVAQRAQRVAQVEPQVDAPAYRLGSFWHVAERLERLLKIAHGRAVGRAGKGPGSRLSRIADGLVPDPAAKRVVGESFRVLRRALGTHLLDGRHDACVEGTAALLEQAAVGHVEGQRVLERVLHVGEETGLVHEFGRLQVVQAPAQLIVRDVGHGLHQGERNVLADHGGALQDPLVFR
jgi:hypothetical protein